MAEKVTITGIPNQLFLKLDSNWGSGKIWQDVSGKVLDHSIIEVCAQNGMILEFYQQSLFLPYSGETNFICCPTFSVHSFFFRNSFNSVC